jgi:hypothetical protein
MTKPKLCKMCKARRFSIRPFYTLRQLAAMAEVSTRRMSALLERHGIESVGRGRAKCIPLAELEEKLSWFRQSVQLRDMHDDIALAHQSAFEDCDGITITDEP